MWFQNLPLLAIPTAIIHNIMGKNIFPYTLWCIKMCRENIFFRLEEAHSSEQKLVSLQNWLSCYWENYLIQEVQLFKDFTTEHARSEVEFYMEMVVDQQSFEGSMDHLTSTFQSCETEKFLIAEFFQPDLKTFAYK